MGSEIQPKPHVIVVGAGVIGASIAWHLASHPAGPAVTIVAEDVGGTATPCSFAWLNASWGNPRFYFDFRRRSLAGWKRLAGELPGVAEVVQWTGSVSWAKSPDELEEYRREYSSWGYDIRRAERAEIQALEPTLDPDALPEEWGLRVGEEGAVEADEAARVMVADAQKRGARLVTATVGDLLRGGGGEVRGVVTSAGETLEADHVVVAAGVATAALCASAGVAVPLTTPASPGLLVHSKPVGRRLLNGIVYHAGGHMRQTADGRLLAGADFVGGDPGSDPLATAREHLEKVKESFRPADRGLLELDRFTIGYRPHPTDGLPILGATGVPGLSIAVMHSGVTNAALVGELLAEKVLTGKEDPAFETYALKRFDETQKGQGASAL